MGSEARLTGGNEKDNLAWLTPLTPNSMESIEEKFGGVLEMKLYAYIAMGKTSRMVFPGEKLSAS